MIFATIVVIAVIIYCLFYEKLNTPLFFVVGWSIVLACDIIAIIMGITCTWDLAIGPVICLVLESFNIYFSNKPNK
jgi:predicted membrane channel-forming protein YqfA (hemolysin III family)